MNYNHEVPMNSIQIAGVSGSMFINSVRPDPASECCCPRVKTCGCLKSEKHDLRQAQLMGEHQLQCKPDVTAPGGFSCELSFKPQPNLSCIKR